MEIEFNSSKNCEDHIHTIPQTIMEYRHYVYVPPSNGNACTCITVNSGFQPFVYSEKVFCTCFTQLFQPFLIVA